jgi:hypothetical protein
LQRDNPENGFVTPLSSKLETTAEAAAAHIPSRARLPSAAPLEALNTGEYY